MKPQSKPARLLVTFILSMVTLACLCSLPFNLSEIIDQLGSSLTDEPPQNIDSPKEELDLNLSEETLGFVAPEMPGTTIPLETGGSIFVPEGALPPGTEVNAQVSKGTPLLPEGIEPVGDALVITVDTQPQSPVLLRLPIPPGVEDPTDLVILRTSPDGMITFLVTWVDGNDLVAYTPGFSSFSIVKFVGGLIKEQKVYILGGPMLLTGQTRTISVRPLPRDHILDADWTVNDKATILHRGDIAATIQAGNQEGWIALTYSAINLTQGYRWFSSTSIQVKRPSEEERSTIPYKSFQASAITESPAVYDDEPFNAQVSFHGLFRYPVVWSYAVQGCLDAVDVITTDARPIALPPVRCPSRNSHYTLEIIAEDGDLKKAINTLNFRVFPKPFMVNIPGPRFLEWKSGGVKENYQATPNDGYNNPLYNYTWRITPGGDWSAIESRQTTMMYEFTFNQPGEHRIEVQVTNGKGDEAKATIPVLVTGADPLDAHILSWPDSIKPDEKINVTFRAGGGTLVVGGQKGGYRVSIYWGDGTMNEESNFAIGQTGYQPIIFDRSHQWAEPGAYTVMLFVEDPTGSIAYAEADIVVADPVVVYEGYVTNSQGFLITNSDVEIKVREDLVVATVSFTFEVDVKWDDQGVACKAILTRVYSGQTLGGTPIEVTLQLETFTDKFEGSDCEDVSVPVIREQTLVGNINDDGSFQGNMRNVWFIYANRVSE